MKSKLLLSLLTIILFACSNQKPDVITIKSDFLSSSDSVLITLPIHYNVEENYPLVILLHGWSGNYMQWNSMVNLQEYANAYNFIIVCPDGFYDSWYLNNILNPVIQYEEFFIKDFIPYLTKHYSVDTNSIFISGLSMGGHGAISLFLKNPQLFRSAASTSGILDLTQFPENWRIKDKIGKMDLNIENWKNNSSYHLLDKVKKIDNPIFIDCGIDDFAYNVNLNFAKKCSDLGINLVFISIPGDHNHKHWKKMLPKHFEFFYEQL